MTRSSLELISMIGGAIILGVWLFSEKYQAEAGVGMLIWLSGVSLYLLSFSQEKLYRIFAKVCLLVVFVALGLAILKWVKLTLS